jgi:hypothetical protein
VEVGPPPRSEEVAAAAMLRNGLAYISKLLRALVELETGTEECLRLLPVVDAARDLPAFIAVRLASS